MNNLGVMHVRVAQNRSHAAVRAMMLLLDPCTAHPLHIVSTQCVLRATHTPRLPGGNVRAWLRELVEPAKNHLTLEHLQQLSTDLQKHVEQNKALHFSHPFFTP